MSVVSGVFKVKSFEDGDSQGFDRVALCQNMMEDNMETRLYLPPFMRKSECPIDVGSKVWGIADTVTGLGCALYGIDCDHEYWSDADLTFKQTLNVKKDVTMNAKLTVDNAVTMKNKLDVTMNITSSADVIAQVSLNNHMHQITLMPQSDVALLATSVLAGGTTPVTFATFWTITPT